MPQDSPKCRSCPYKAMAKFKKPSIEEIAEYAKKIGYNSLNAEDFFWYNEARGWVSNKGIPYKSWKAVVQTWFRMAKKRGDIQEQKETFREKHLRRKYNE